jgi:hypothetical protein
VSLASARVSDTSNSHPLPKPRRQSRRCRVTTSAAVPSVPTSRLPVTTLPEVVEEAVVAVAASTTVEVVEVVDVVADAVDAAALVIAVEGAVAAAVVVLPTVVALATSRVAR